MPREGDTIFALSSGALPAAIAIVRVSGPAAAEALTMLAGRLPRARHAHLARLRDEAGLTLDQGLVLWFPGPASATGEDLAEFHLHGGRAVVAAVLERLGRISGCRLAEPGEFTRRAFFNGRLDLAQAEGVGDLLAADTEQQRRQAIRAAEGGLGRLVTAWRERLLQLSARIEADLEFGETDDVDTATDKVRAQAVALRYELEQVLAQPAAERLRDGLRVVIAGPVNAGKSTLLNALAGREAAIATPVAGTTRDLIEVPLDLDGLPLILIDTAGLRADVADPVERIGVARGQEATRDADLILWLGPEQDAVRDERTIIVAARIDVAPPRGRYDVALSSKTGAGLNDLRDLLGRRARAMLPSEPSPVLNERHRGAVRQAASHLLVETLEDSVLLAEHIREARLALGRIAGYEGGVEAMLDALFAGFCIGK